MREFVTLLGREAEPAHRLSIVRRHTLAEGVHESESELCIDVALLGGEVKPPCGLGVVFGDTDYAYALDVHVTESRLRDSVALFCVHSEHLDRIAGEM